jgi:hypothetical protein
MSINIKNQVAITNTIPQLLRSGVGKLLISSKMHGMLIDIAKEMGYPYFDGGMCSGITSLGGFVILTEDLTSFNSRLRDQRNL